MGVQVPPFARVLAFSLALAACQSEAERLQSESLYYLKQVEKILEHDAGRMDQALADLDRFFEEYGARIQETNARGRELLRTMPPEEREAFIQRSNEAARPIRERIETLARTFPNPPVILKRLKDLMI